MLESVRQKCDCGSLQKAVFERKLTKSPNGERSVTYGYNTQRSMLEERLIKRRLGGTPCRKTCSTIHNPMFHAARYSIEIKACRPGSAESRDYDKIDWINTDIDAAIKQNEEQRRMMLVSFNDFDKPLKDS